MRSANSMGDGAGLPNLDRYGCRTWVLHCRRRSWRRLRFVLIVIFCGSLDLATDVADEIGQASGGKPTNGIGFLPNCRLVAWDVVGELRDLHSYDAAKGCNHA